MTVEAFGLESASAGITDSVIRYILEMRRHAASAIVLYVMLAGVRDGSENEQWEKCCWIELTRDCNASMRNVSAAFCVIISHMCVTLT